MKPLFTVEAILFISSGNTKLRPDQLEAVFRRMSSSETQSDLRLRHLILRDVDLSTLNHLLLHDGLHSVLTLNLQVGLVSLSLGNINTIWAHSKFDISPQ